MSDGEPGRITDPDAYNEKKEKMEACGATVLTRALEAAHGGRHVLDFSIAYP